MSTVTRQKGVSSSTPSALRRWLTSQLMTYVGSEHRQTRLRRKREAARRREGRSHVVAYFHQVDDGYSHLALQALAKLCARYAIMPQVHLVPALRDENVPEPELLLQMSRVDAAKVAPYYGLDFPACQRAPDAQACRLAAAILAHLPDDRWLDVGPRVSDCLWRSEQAGLQALANEFGGASESEVDAALARGAERRTRLKHYSGAMFWYEGEWYWGVDRLYHLEQRLTELGALKDSSLPEVAPRPAVATSFPDATQDMTLEYFPSLRSPYSAVSWDPTMKLVADSGVRLEVKPVLPMVMRGVPATLDKGLYIVADAAREARAMKVDYGRCYDPIGEPVLRGFSLYTWARKQGRGNELLGAFLKAAFARGINTNRNAGLREVVRMAGLDWHQAKTHLHDQSWRELLEENRQRIYASGIWGVPSYRLLDREGRELLSVWGQDRLWLVAEGMREAHARSRE